MLADTLTNMLYYIRHTCTLHKMLTDSGKKHNCTYTLVLILVFTTAIIMATWPPIQGVSQQEATRLVVSLGAGTPALSPYLHGALSAAGYSSMGLQDP